MTLPTQARVVIVGGGIVGCSTAYHLTKLGVKDVLLLERARLTSGTTWHAAGLVGQMRPNRNMTQMSRYGIDLYSGLEKETGLATGWKQCGSVNVAQTAERFHSYKRIAAAARGFGVEMHLVSPAEAGKLWPLMRTDDLAGAVWVPGDGKANPTDLTQSLAKGARMGGARLVEGVRVAGFDIRKGRVHGVRTSEGDVACETVILCAGQWSRQVGALAGVDVPLHSAEHYYIVTRPIPGVPHDLPVMRDPDAFIYYKEEVGGLVMGGFEPSAKPWGMDGIPENFEFQLLAEDWDQFEVLMQGALRRTPVLETAEIRQLLNGPESFTPDGNFILGEAPGLFGFYVAAGFNSAGIANAGGAGRLMAEWVVGGEAPLDLWDVDIRRFGAPHANARFLKDRTVESLGLHYMMRWPRHELVSARPMRRSPLYDRLAGKSARFGSKMGWERANYFGPDVQARFAKPAWLPYVEEEQKAARDGVVVVDQTSFGKILVQGRDAAALLQHLCANDVDVAPGKIVYTAMLNRRGGFESDLTAMRLAEETFLLITGSAQPARDMDWLRRHVGDRFVTLFDATSAWAVLSVIGPGSAALVPSIPLGETREIDLGLGRVRAARMSYAGGPATELYVPSEMAVAVYDHLVAEGARDAGYWALDGLRIEAGRRAFAAELGPDETPLDAGLMHAVKLEKGDFLGRDALLRQRDAGTKKRLALFLVEDGNAWAWGGEGILRDGKPVGEITSAGWSHRLRRAVAMGYVRGDGAPVTAEHVLSATYEIDIAGERIPARVLEKPAFPYGRS